jgi:hypothetical protein
LNAYLNRYVGPSYFNPKTTQKIPSWFHFFREDKLGDEYVKAVSTTNENAFIVVPDPEDATKGVVLVFKTDSSDTINRILSYYKSYAS